MHVNIPRVIILKDFQFGKDATEVKTVGQLVWGLKRFIYDAMLYWGNFKDAYKALRNLSFEDITILFLNKRQNLEDGRGAIVEPTPIPYQKKTGPKPVFYLLFYKFMIAALPFIVCEG